MLLGWVLQKHCCGADKFNPNIKSDCDAMNAVLVASLLYEMSGRLICRSKAATCNEHRPIFDDLTSLCVML